MQVVPIYAPTFNDKLLRATPLTDSVALYQFFENEYAEGFYSYTPWWPASENRTMVFFADVIFNNVFFYV